MPRERLNALYKKDAVKFFRAQGIRGPQSKIEAICESYGYHPLSLRILAGLLSDNREAPGDIAYAKYFQITNDIIANKHHVLEQAYVTLTPQQKILLSTIACCRSSIPYETLKYISG